MSRIAAMDISKKRIGIAFSDEDCTFVSKSFLLTSNFIEQIKELFEEYQPSITYIGMPKNLDGSNSHQTIFVKTFCHNIRNIIGKFEYKDERFSTKLAEQIMTPKSVDEMVAINILNNAIKYKI